jgi:GTP cyclohydrolase II
MTYTRLSPIEPSISTGHGRDLRIRAVVQVPLTLADGRIVPSEMVSFFGLRDKLEHFAVRLGPRSADVAPLVRLHSECMTGDVLGSARCDCGPQLNEAIKRLSCVGGYLLYMRQEGRGIGLYRKLDAYLLQQGDMDTYAANRALGRADDERDYGAAADMLLALGVNRIRLLSNNPDKRAQLVAEGIEVESLAPTGVYLGPHNRQYLEAKVRQTNHTIDLNTAGVS